MQVFQNGPNWGRDVFIPMDYIIGGQERLGQGWKMLMTALAAGRAFRCRHCPLRRGLMARTTGAYARIRRTVRHFHRQISKASRSRSPAIAGTAYLLDAARRLTCAALTRATIPPSSPAS